MFTGIIEEMGTVVSREEDNGNLKLGIQSSFNEHLQVDQSVAHNGICLTVDEVLDDAYTVTAIQETLDRTNLGAVEIGDAINLERAMISGARLDGHMVQGHVDQTATCSNIVEKEGSWEFTFTYNAIGQNVTVEKGSICVNGVSLTVFNSEDTAFSVAIIPYTFQHTNLKFVEIGSIVNLEFDIIGKYVQKMMGDR